MDLLQIQASHLRKDHCEVLQKSSSFAEYAEKGRVCQISQHDLLHMVPADIGLFDCFIFSS